MRNETVLVAIDKKGNRVVVINNIIFHGKRSIPWDDVEKYLQRYIGDIVEVAETGELLYIDSDFPDEFKGSKDTKRARGATAKAKANVTQGIHEIIHIARKVKVMENVKEKNRRKAMGGWYRYLTRFALPVTTDGKVISHYNIYLATLIVRKDERDKLYLYDIVNIKKETSTPFEL